MSASRGRRRPAPTSCRSRPTTSSTAPRVRTLRRGRPAESLPRPTADPSCSASRLAGPDATVVRTSWVYSRHPGNMVATICRLIAPGRRAGLRRRPDRSPDLHRVAGGRRSATWPLPAWASGIFHCTNAGAVSWYGFTRAVLAAAGESPERVRPIATADLDPPRPAPRPADSRLANRRYERHVRAACPTSVTGSRRWSQAHLERGSRSRPDEARKASRARERTRRNRVDLWFPLAFSTSRYAQ